MFKKYIPFLLPIVFLISYTSTGDDFDGRIDNPFPLTEVEQQWVEQTLNSMSLKEKCAQMIMSNAASSDTSFDSKEFNRLVKLVSEFKVGGLIFFQGSSLSQILTTNKLQSLSEVPLLISSDYERGPGMRLNDIVQFPHNMALGATYEPHLTYLMGRYTARTSRSLGVHINFAPILDVNQDYRNPVINIRAYSEDPNIISWHGNAFIAGMHEEAMITTAKHFPGHGATDLDSHQELPLIGRTLSQLENVDLIPFREALKAGTQSVMIGHLDIPAMEKKSGTPATLSSSIITEFLKKKLSFNGLIITDALNMKSIIDSFDADEAASLAVQAGNDLLLFPSDDSLAIEGVYNSVIDNIISEERINNSVRKILSAKKWLHLDTFNQIELDEANRIINNPGYRRLAKEIAEKSVTLIKDKNNLIPVDPSDYHYTASLTLRSTSSRSSLNETKLFQKLVENNFGYVKAFTLNLRSKEKAYDNVFEKIEEADLILLNLFITSYKSDDFEFIDEKQTEIIKKLIALEKPLIISNFGNPYIFKEFSEAPTYLCSYSFTDASQEAVFNSITGRNQIAGRLPVSIPGTDYGIGFGLKRNITNLFLPDTLADTNYYFYPVDSLMLNAVKDSVFPGGVLLIAHRGRPVYHKQFGRYTYDNLSEAVTENSIFDLASLTKVAATTSAAMILYDKGLLNLEEKAGNILPGFRGDDKERITVKQLLTHNSGLPAFKRYYTMYNSSDEVIDDIMNCELIFKPGTDYTYSDLGMIIMQLIIEKITGEKFDSYLKNNLFDLLEMKNTFFNPPPEKWFFCVPTEIDDYWRFTTVKGKVHDENAHLLGGVAGHAGLFSTASDLWQLMFVYGNKGKYKDLTIFKPETVELFTSHQTRYGDRGLGWGIKSVDGYSSAGTRFSESSFGHTGFTGTSIWFDKEKELCVILLTNRVFPTRDNKKISRFRPILHDEIVDAVTYK